MIVRDRFVGQSGYRELPAKIRSSVAYSHVVIPSSCNMPFLDLRGAGCHAIRVPTDTVRGIDHSPGRSLGARIYAHHKDQVDGIVFHSRHTGASVYAVFSWALSRLNRGASSGQIENHTDLADVMRAHRIRWRQ